MTRLLAREPLTVTELETLAVLLDSGTRRMSRARTDDGVYFVWTGATGIDEVYEDVFSAFYQLRSQAADADPAAYRVTLA